MVEKHPGPSPVSNSRSIHEIVRRQRAATTEQTLILVQTYYFTHALHPCNRVIHRSTLMRRGIRPKLLSHFVLRPWPSLGLARKVHAGCLAR